MPKFAKVKPMRFAPAYFWETTYTMSTATAGHINAGVKEKCYKNDVFLPKKIRLKHYFWWIYKHVSTRFFMPVNFLSTSSMNCIIFKAKKFDWFFTRFWQFFHSQANFRTLSLPPESDSWGFHGENVFQFGPRKLPKPLLAKE